VDGLLTAGAFQAKTRWIMEFRWIALIALWTMVSGPIFGTPSGPASGSRQAEKKVVKPAVPQQVRR
jgi:hypothetical protein